MGGHSAAHSGSWGGDRSRANSAGKECPRRTSRVAGLESGFRRAGGGTGARGQQGEERPSRRHDAGLEVRGHRGHV